MRLQGIAAVVCYQSRRGSGAVAGEVPASGQMFRDLIAMARGANMQRHLIVLLNHEQRPASVHIV
jgi:hypothetical protein